MKIPLALRWNNSYRSQWQLKDNQLWLVRLEQINCDGEAVEVSPEDLFGQTHYPILADWYNGNCCRIRPPHMIAAISPIKSFG
ncbi:hypothetical protein ACFQMB_03890 [Pseudobowmanella zhangzhouensis]|uniref:hypothetical protein n=1 Tax=Pseudobowmanella zhangzhouensis TaxID=1537679 RepID=UPI00360F074B